MEPELYKKFTDIVREFPQGTTVYHKGNAKRGIVVAYIIINESISIGADYGENNVDYSYKICLSKDKVDFHTPDKESDGWKG